MARSTEEERLLGKIKGICIVLLFVTVVFIGVMVVLLPAFLRDYHIPEGALIAILASLTTSGLGLAGVSLRKDG
jgi:hypothetical protein